MAQKNPTCFSCLRVSTSVLLSFCGKYPKVIAIESNGSLSDKLVRLFFFCSRHDTTYRKVLETEGPSVSAGSETTGRSVA